MATPPALERKAGIEGLLARTENLGYVNPAMAVSMKPLGDVFYPHDQP